MRANTYVVDKGITDRREAFVVCQAVLDVLGDRPISATVDAYSDFDDVMPPDVQEAMDEVRSWGRRQGLRDPGFGAELDLSRGEVRELLRVVAPWSINVDLWDADRRVVATFHDCGYSVTFEGTALEVEVLSARLGGIARVISLDELQVNRRAGRVAVRQQKWAEFTARVLKALRLR